MPRITARLSDPYHPNFQTVRGGITWTRDWQTADLDAEDAAAVKADANLEVRSEKAKATKAPSALAERRALVAEAKALNVPAKGKNADLLAAIAAAKAAPGA